MSKSRYVILVEVSATEVRLIGDDGEAEIFTTWMRAQETMRGHILESRPYTIIKLESLPFS